MNAEGNETNEIIKPQLAKGDELELLKRLYGFDGGNLVQMNGYDDLNYHYTKPQSVSNPHIPNLCPDGYILKVINYKDSENTQMQEAQTDLLLFLSKQGITCSMPVKNKFGNYFSKEKLPVANNGIRQRNHIVKLLEFQPGVLLKNVNCDYSMYYQIGVLAATLNKASKKFQHPAYDTHEMIWHLNMLPKVKLYTHVIQNKEMKNLAEEIMNEFIENVAPRMNPSDKQIIHGDLNSQNIICREINGEWKISAVIDFGDSHVSYPTYEVAISMFYTMLDCKEKTLDHLVGAGHTLAGYIHTDKRIHLDYLLLKRCILARLCQSYVLGVYNSLVQPDNNYISESLMVYPQLLTELLPKTVSDLQDTWENIINSYS